MNGELGTYDRATILVWRALNVVGWSLAAFGGATVLRYAFEALPTVISNERWYGIIAGVGAPVLCGLFIGSLIGAHVARAPIVVAGVVSASFAGLASYWMVQFVLYSGGPLSPAIVYWTFLSVPVALLAARSAASRRPRLSYGRSVS